MLITSTGIAQNVYTPKGTLVPPNSYFTYNTPQSHVNAFYNDLANGLYGPTPVIVANANDNYNCHGYAWNMYPSDGRQVPIDDFYYNAVSTYINDQSFKSTTNTTLPGVLVRYSGDHSAVVINVTNRLMSKWGWATLTRHAPGDVPPGYGLPSSYYQCNFPSRLTHAQINNGTISNGTSVSFQANTGSHYIDVYGTPNTIYSFATQPSVPGISIYAQYSNRVLFDKPAYNQQGRYIFVTMSNGCTVPSAQTSMFIYDPPGASMMVYPVPIYDEVTIQFADLEEKLVMEDMTYYGEGPSLPVSIEVFNGSNIKVDDLSEEIITKKTNKVSLAHLGKGTYYIKATFKDGFVETKRVIVN
ncbi:hypothetical protein [Algoriphagus sp.]|uniref:hypothetical protein n=1 Tax=Algoriphagus sp. TaxID=1872435 RepID=UPI003F70746F